MIRQINQASAYSAFCIGLLLNISLIWLILRKSPVEMRVFSRILLQTCCTDLVMLFATLLTQPIYTTDNSAGIVLLNGLMKDVDLIAPNVVLFLWDNCFFFAFFGFSAQFVYRYLILNRNADISAVQYFCTMFAVVLFLDFLLAIFLFSTGFPSPPNNFCCENSVILLILDGISNEKIRLAQRAGTYYPLAWLAVTICISIAYAVIFICTFAIRQYVRMNLKGNSGKLGEINQQLTWNMLIQALLPLLTLIPVWITLAISVMNVTIPNSNTIFLQFMMLIRLPVHWIPVFNPIVTILTVKHYKRAIGKVLTRRSLSNSVQSEHTPGNEYRAAGGSNHSQQNQQNPLFQHRRPMTVVVNQNMAANLPTIST